MSDDGKILDIKTADLKATAPTFHEQSVAVERALNHAPVVVGHCGRSMGR